MKFLISVFLCITAPLAGAMAQTIAPGGPGKDAQWATAAKQGIGTSASLQSKVWFTLAQGVMTEVYYPDVTVANVHLLQFVVVDPETKQVETERDNTMSASIVNIRSKPNRAGNPAPANPKLEIPSGQLAVSDLEYLQINIAKSGAWAISKTFITDPSRNAVVVKVRFSPRKAGLRLYVYYDPSLSNSGMHDTAWSDGQTFLAQDGQISSALSFSVPILEMSNGYVGTTDGIGSLSTNGKLNLQFAKAVDGNVAQTALVDYQRGKDFVFSLAFGSTPEEAKSAAQGIQKISFEEIERAYLNGWSEFVENLPKVDPKYQSQFNMAAMVLKAQEDKTVRGANVASLTIPWGGGKNANEDVGGGYHLVWARDLYHVFTAYLALGDRAAAERALDFLFDVQQKEDGSFPQNSQLNGKGGWGGLQMDEVGYPLIMAWQLGRFDKNTYENHVKRAADFIVKNGPVTPQERWEEKGGYSPSTIAAEIAGLVCAADIAKRNGDAASAKLYLDTADNWQANIEKWTATTTGKFGDGHYYLRLTQHGKPDAGEKIELNNGAGTFDEREIVDAGFLELVRLGIKSPDDPLIVRSVKVIDDQLRVKTPNSESFYRYSHDGYGEMDDGRKWNWDGKYTGKGRLWALLAGERGQYEIAECGSRNAVSKAETGPVGSVSPDSLRTCLVSARSRLDSMLGFANEGLMVPEQIWDKPAVPTNYDHEWVPELKFGEGTGSATPLAWSMAQFIRLATNLKAGRNLDTPQIVYDRYVLRKQ